MEKFKDGKLDYREVIENKEEIYSQKTVRMALRQAESVYEANLDLEMEARYGDE